MSKKTNTKQKAKAAPKPKAKSAPAKKAKAAPAKKAKSAPVKKAPVKAAPKAKASPKPLKKVVAKAPLKKAPVKVVAKIPVAKAVVPAKAAAIKVAPVKPTSTKVPASKVEAAAPIAPAKPKKRIKAPKVVVVKPQLPPRNEIPAPPKERPVIGRPALFNRRPEPALNMSPKPQEDSGKTRYSDNELEEFRAIINKKLEEARKELGLLQAQMTAANDHGTDDTASTFKILEDGSDSLAKEEAGQLASRQKKFIEQLENAMVRIENKTYGLCRVTGKLIPKERLRAVPHTTQSIEAKLKQYRD